MDTDSPAGRARGPYAKSAERRRQIVDEAYRMFSTRGYQASSLREIAGAAGISLSNLQHHFASKEELLLAVLERRDETPAAETAAADTAENADENAAVPFDAAMVARAAANERIPGLIALYSVLSAEGVTDGHPGREFFLRRYDSLRAGYTAEFEEVRRQGRLRSGVDPAMAAASVVALWEGIQLQWLYAPDRIHAADALRAYLDLVIVSADDEGADA
ncbi:TetR/AcrR family transcriptional regulator [Leifsonia poae]|uniref:TetR family transcriptional regulator n=1 Tax=Leifsonia poae TaxID=110933 RepID=A0A9W6HE81_9MICO|nr:TetR/AcrR family transcriptional regulator [Leifsonia poae]GLJ78282.1 TetR family transcriptional regulator [Leifsonia poae]